MSVNAGTVHSELVLDTSKYEAALKTAQTQMVKFGSDLEKSGEKMSDLGGTMTKSLTLPIVGAGTAAVLAADNIKDATDTIAFATGKTGDALAGLEDSFRNVLGKVDEGATEVAKVLAQLHVSTDATGKALEDLTTRTLLYAKVNKVDASDSARTLGRLMNALELDVAELPLAMDKLTKAAQLSGIGVNELASYVIEAGPAFEEMGFNLDRAIGLFAEFYKAGANPAEVLSSLNIVLNRMAADGSQNAEEAFNSLLAEIKAAPDILSATLIASEAFGARVGAKVAEDIRAGRFEVDEWVTALQGAEGTLVKTAEGTGKFSEDLAVLKNQTILAVEPLGKSLVGALSKALEAAKPLLDVIKRAADAFANLSPKTQESIIKMVGLTAAMGPALTIGGKLIGGVGSGIKWFGKLQGVLSTTTAATAAGTTATAGLTSGIGATGLAAKAGAALLNPWTLGIGAAVGAGVLLYKHLKEEAIPTVNLFGEETSKATKEAVGSFLDMSDKTTVLLNELSWTGQVVTKDMAGAIVGNYSDMARQVESGLDNHYKESISKMQAFFAESQGITEEEQADILAKMEQHHEDQRTSVAEKEARIKEIMEQASAEKRALTKDEQKEIADIQEEMKTTAVKTLSETEVESKLILERMREQASDITARQAAEVVKNSAEQRDKAIAAAEEQYDEVIRTVIRQRDEAGIISAEQADTLIAEAKRQRDEAVVAAKDMHGQVVAEAQLQAEEHIKEIDWETGEIKTKWQTLKAWFEDNPIVRWIKTLSAGENSAVIGTGSVPTPLASGTSYFPGGFAWVGEQGPELIELPRGSKVYTAQDSERMASQLGAGITQNITINSPSPMTPSEIARQTKLASQQLAIEWGLR